MKKFTLLFLLSLFCVVSSGTITGEFSGWNDLIDRSPDIVIVKCTSSLGGDKLRKPFVIVNGWIPSEIDVISILKGKTKPGPSRLMSKYWPYPGENLLLFGTYAKDSDSENYSAYEDYRVVPLDHYFQTNQLVGQTLEEKIKWCLQRRLADLNEELKKGQQEKTRLEYGLKTLK